MVGKGEYEKKKRELNEKIREILEDFVEYGKTPDDDTGFEEMTDEEEMALAPMVEAVMDELESWDNYEDVF